MLEKIKNENLKEIIFRELKKEKFEDIKENDLEKIENILLEEFDIANNKTGITINDIFYFPKLKYITLDKFLINDELIETLNKYILLNTISFVKCEFKIKQITDMKNVPETLKFIDCKNIPETLPTTKNLYFNQCDIDFNSINFDKMKYLKIEYSNVKNIHDIDKSTKIDEIYILQSKLFNKRGEEINSIKVPKNTIFTNEKREREFIDNRYI